MTKHKHREQEIVLTFKSGAFVAAPAIFMLSREILIKKQCSMIVENWDSLHATNEVTTSLIVDSFHPQQKSSMNIRDIPFSNPFWRLRTFVFPFSTIKPINQFMWEANKVRLILITKQTCIESKNDSRTKSKKEKTRCRLMVNYQLNNS